MPADRSELVCGAVCLALYPFTTGFPLTAALEKAESEFSATFETFENIEEFQATIAPGDVPEVVTQVKLRRVLLLQTATDDRMKDVVVARVSSIRDKHRDRKQFYRRLESGSHPTSMLIGNERRHGTSGSQCYINFTSISTISANAILRRVGYLNESEMRAVSRRLVRTLELDLSDLDYGQL